MKVPSAIVLAAALVAASPASAQVIDLSTVKCKEFLESGQENIAFIMMWLMGYYSEEDDAPIVDFGKMKSDGAKLGAYCAKNPAVGLITAAEATIAK